VTGGALPQSGHKSLTFLSVGPNIADMTSVPYHHKIGILPDDIDHMGHVNNSVYLKWVQEAVVRYWETIAPPEAVARHLWVALSHEIKYRRPAFLDDLVVADVIAEKVEGARAAFTTLIMRGEEVIAEVKSSWCCLDAVSKRPARLARDIIARFVPLA
jgi:acyl-CoA thioester hydrolase